MPHLFFQVPENSLKHKKFKIIFGSMFAHFNWLKMGIYLFLLQFDRILQNATTPLSVKQDCNYFRKTLHFRFKEYNFNISHDWIIIYDDHGDNVHEFFLRAQRWKPCSCSILIYLILAWLQNCEMEKHQVRQKVKEQ